MKNTIFVSTALFFSLRTSRNRTHNCADKAESKVYSTMNCATIAIPYQRVTQLPDRQQQKAQGKHEHKMPVLHTHKHAALQRLHARSY